MKHLITLLLLCLYQLSTIAQIDGDNIFENDQIIKIELNFSQTSFWDSLTTNYNSSTYMKADLILTDSTGSSEFLDVGVRLKGNSSYGHPGNKKSFKIDFNKYVSGQDYDGLKKLNFSNGFKDPTLMREKLFFDFCRAAGVPAPRANYADVYFNGTFWGFYSVIEQIDDQFLDWKILDDDGNLFKAGSNFGGGPGGGGDEADLVYYGDDQSAYEDLYVLKSNEDENDWSDLISFTDFINNASMDDFENNLADRLELQEYLRSAAIDNLFSNLDSYTGSARNYYIYHNLTTDKWQWIKWDANESFGLYRAGPGINDQTRLPLDHHDNNRPLLENIFNSQKLSLQYNQEICFLIDNFFNTEYMDDRINKIRNLIQDAVYNDTNKMYSDANFDDNVENNISVGGGPGGGNIYGLKSFINSKFNFVQDELDCSLISSNSNLIPADLSVYPNPFNDILTIEGAHAFSDLTIFNYLGQKLISKSIHENKSLILTLDALEKGIYFIELSDNKTQTHKTVTLPLVKAQ